MQEIQRSIFDTLTATSEIGRHHKLRDPRAFEDARGTLRLIHDNFDHLLEQRGSAGLLQALREATGSVRGALQDLLPELSEGGEALQRALDGLERSVRSVGHSLEIPSKPLLGVLPVARVIPQDVHSVMDYGNAIATCAAASTADTMTARIACGALSAAVGGISAMTDYRLSAAKLVPIEVHEASDYLWGAMAIAAPFALGFFRKDKAAAAVCIATGAATILGSLFTDYRAARGVGRGWGQGQRRQ